MIYDAETGDFVQLLTTGGLLVNELYHPFVIIRAQYLRDYECAGLTRCIDELMAGRRAAKLRDEERLLERASAGRTNVAGGEIRGESSRHSDTGNAGPASGDVSDWPFDMEGGVDIRVIAVFNDDPNDHDYVEQSSDGRPSETDEVVDSSDEEEEAMETDDEDEREVIDLTYLSDSTCSQEI